MENKKEEEFENPIDPDKIAENPNFLPYASNVGSALIKPIDRGRVKGLAVEAMYEQTDMQLNQIREQIELLAQQARSIKNRVEISERIYKASVGIKPLINKIYHLYVKSSGENVLSIVAPEEWGKNPPYQFIASVRLLADHTWEPVRVSEEWKDWA